jgi:hypothetical protein
MNTKRFAGSLFTAAALAFGAPAAAEEPTFLFTTDDIIFAPWVSPYDETEEPLGFRLAGPDGFSLTAFGASPYAWENTTFILGFAAAPGAAYIIDWAASWLNLNGTPASLVDFAPTNAAAGGQEWLAAHPWGGDGLSPETTWIFTAPAHVLDLGGGQIAWRVTGVPEPQAWAMLLAGLVLLGAMARPRAG